MSPAILIADDHPLFREALKLAISQAFTGARTLEADTVDSLLGSLHAHPDIDLLLLDLGMPGAHGFSALVQTRAHYPSVPVVVISGREDQDIAQRTLVHGASAFIAKSASVPTIIDALKTILHGEVWTAPDVVPVAGARGNRCRPTSRGRAPRRQPHAPAVPGVVHALLWPIEQTHRPAAPGFRGHRQGAHDGHPREDGR